MKRTVTTLVFILAAYLGVAVAQAPFHEVKPKKGDGILTLLTRYKLQQYQCNIDKFYALNNLKKNAPLYTYKKYKIPVYIYKYNGKTIRSTVDISDWDKAVRIQMYNEDILKRGLRRTHFKDSKILWVPYHELSCFAPADTKKNKKKAEKVAKKGMKVLDVPLFGEKYRKVKILDHSLKGHVYYIVSGHGGPDPGAMCHDYSKPIAEDEYAYDIALRLARNLMQHGAMAHVIIQDENDGIRDERLLEYDRDEKTMGKYKIPLNQKARLNQRVIEINKLYRYHKKHGAKKQLALFLHIDSSSKSLTQDVYFYHHKSSKKGKKVANNIKKTFKKKYQKYQKGRGYTGHVSARGLYVMNYTQPTSVFIELGNIRNKNDHRRIMIKENRQALANWIYEGIK